MAIQIKRESVTLVEPHLSISRTTSNTSEDYISLTIGDADGRLVELAIPLAEFTRAVTGQFVRDLAARHWPR